MNCFNRIFCIWGIFQCSIHFSCTNANQPFNYDFVISKDSSADFHTVQEAFDALPDSSTDRITILIRKGTYKEKLVLPSGKIYVTLIGEERDSTCITYDDFSGRIVNGDTLNTHNSCSFRILADDFLAENITFENSAGKVGQAVAVEVNSDRVIFVNCRFLGNQDTYYTNSAGRIYMKDCYIEGTTDFIFGKSIVVFDRCMIHSKKNSYITAASTPEGYKYGYVFLNCSLTADTNIIRVFLGRPWRDFAKVVFIRCSMDGHIEPEGWHNWDKPWRERTAYYAEYKCYGAGSDTTRRVPWSHQLTDEEALCYTLQKIFSAHSAFPPLTGDWFPVYPLYSKTEWPDKCDTTIQKQNK
jgi:pectinesterase